MSKEKVYIKEFWEVRFRDIDPDTSYVAQDKLMALCVTSDSASMLKEIIQDHYGNVEQDPNREFYIKENNLELHV
jgi:hypothetical protein